MTGNTISEALQKQKASTLRAAFAEGTRGNLKSQWKKFSVFCDEVGEVPLPISVEDLTIYAQYLSNSLKSPQSVRNYINGLRVLHAVSDLPVTSFYSMDLKLMLKGIRRLKKHVVKQACPITLPMLFKLSTVVNLQDSAQQACWSAILIAFFCMLRSSNLVPKTSDTFDPKKQLCKSDFLMGPDCVVVKIRWSKTIQFAQKHYHLPLLRVPSSPLCPVHAASSLLKLVSKSPSPAAFVWKSGKVWKSLIYSRLLRQLKAWVKAIGYDPKKFSLHSLRRGSASLAFDVNVPGEVIKAQGDWASDAYLRYLNISLAQRCQVAEALQQAVVSFS